MTTLGHVETLAPSATDNPARRLLEADRCALIVVDIQEKLLPPIFNREQLIRNSRLLLRLASIMKLPLLATTQYLRGLGPTVPEITELLPGVEQHDKVEFSSFGAEPFCKNLEKLTERDTLLLCGMESHICVMQTAISALNKGYTVHVAADAIGSRTEANWRAGLKRMEAAGCVMSTTEMMMYELMRKSSSAAFKEMLQHLK
ncbi:MAG TPA: hydrolase [Candidatus Acidoferrales bacterium]|nr:hydrolase [Candidatus Acidoferrales bacterium]